MISVYDYKSIYKCRKKLIRDTNDLNNTNKSFIDDNFGLHLLLNKSRKTRKPCFIVGLDKSLQQEIFFPSNFVSLSNAFQAEP